MNDKIKMFIANEEVVSNNDFTINEEMLSASSTILNNCYPKSWELTKDYVSNFYYPKDYSRFVLAQGEYEHGNQEFQPLEITGKNLFDAKSGTIGYVKNDGTIGNATDNYASDYIYLGQNVDFTISANQTMNNIGIAFFDNNKNIILPRKDNNNKQTVSSNTGNAYYIRFWVQKTGQTMSADLVISYQVQLELGSTATSYEPYNQPNLSYETNVEKEWNNFNIYGRTYQKTRNKSLYNGTCDKTINNVRNIVDLQYATMNGTSNGDGRLSYKLQTLKAGTYTLCCKYISGTFSSSASYAYNIIRVWQGDTWTTFGNQINLNSTTNQEGYTTFTLDSDTEISLGVYVRVSDIYSNFKYAYQIISGSSADFNFEPYGVSPSPDYPSELISVGYQNLLIEEYEQGSGVNNTTNRIRTKNLVKITKGKKYTLTMFGDNASNYNYVINTSSTQSTLPFTNGYYDCGNSTVWQGATPISFTATKDGWLVVVIKYPNDSTIAPIDFTNVKLMLTDDGNQEHSYITYGKYGIEIKTTRKNLFNMGHFATIINNDVSIASNNNSSIIVNGTAAATRNFWFNNISMDLEAGTYYFSLSYADNNMTYFLRQNGTNIVGTKVNTSFTINQKTHIDQILIQIASGLSLSNKTINIQLERGSQTTYEPYTSNTQLYVLDEPLRQIGDYKDKLYTDGRVLYVERNIAEKTLEGADYDSGGTTGTNAYFLGTKVECLDNSNIIIGMSNMFAPVSFTNRANGLDVIYGQNGKVVLRTANNTSINWSNGTNRYNWLEANNPKINYVLATPTITPLGYIDLPSSYEGQNNVSIYTGLDTRTEIYYYWKNYDVLFAGVVKNSGDISLNPRHPHYCSLQILDYKTFLSESNTLDFVIANKTISEAIEMVVNAVSGYGFVVGNIDIDSANDIIGAYSTLNKTAYDVLQYLAEISGSRWRARVIDSLTMAIDFYDPDTLPEADDIEYTKEYWEANNIVDMTFNYGSRDYRNKQILLSNEVYGNINYEETLISNGYGDTFTVQNNIGVLLNVIVDGAEKTIATINDKQMGIDADFYYTPGKNIIESNGVYSAGTMIRATYQPLVKGRQIVYNASEVERISNQTQTEGVIARYESRNDILSSEELQKIAQTYIDYKGKAEVIIKITTQDNDLYDIGEVVYFNAPIDDLKQNYMVKAKDIEYIIIDKIIHLFYVYELTSSFNSEKAINYFDNQRNKASGNIAEGESITRNIDIETEVGIIWTDGSVSSTTITVDGDNVLNSVLNSPFVE